MHEDYFEDIEFLLKRTHYSGMVDENYYSTYANETATTIYNYYVLFTYLLVIYFNTDELILCASAREEFKCPFSFDISINPPTITPALYVRVSVAFFTALHVSRFKPSYTFKGKIKFISP